MHYLKYLILVLLAFFLLPVVSYAQTSISPSSKNFYWSAMNTTNNNIDSANFNYTSGYFQVGPASEVYSLLRQGAILNYQATSGSYSATVTYYWATGTINYQQSAQYCNIWASDLTNNSCSIISTRTDTTTINGVQKDVVKTTVLYNWSSATGYVELYLDYTGTTFQPRATYFRYTLDQFYFNPDFSSQIVDQNNIIINQNNEVINNISNVSNVLNDQLSSSVDSNLASQYFNFVSHNDHPLSGLITAPVNFLNSLDDTCQPITLPVTLGGGQGCGGLPVCVNPTYSKNVTLKCGDTIFWGRSDVSSFRNIWNILFGGSLIYLLGVRLFKTINKALDPFSDEINDLEV